MKKLVVAAALLSLLCGVWWLSRIRVNIANESGQSIRFLTIEGCDRTIRFDNIAPGDSVSVALETPDREDYLKVQGRLEDGTSIHGHDTYIVWEDYFRRFHLVVRQDGEVVDR